LPRTLSKSDFTLARSCATKLYYKELGYPQNTDDNPYLAMLAEGGYMVELLAKQLFPDGVAVEYDPRDPVGSAGRTAELLARDEATLFEATLLHDRLLARVDILRKRGNRFELIEVKSVSFDSDEARELPAGPFRGKRAPYPITSKFVPYLEDVAYQVHVLSLCYPDAEIVPYLMLVDQARRTTIDGLPAMFRVRREVDGHDLVVEFVGDVEAVRRDDLLARVDVREEVRLMLPEVAEAASAFAALLGDEQPTRAETPISWDCRGCEFRVGADEPENGFRECWGKLGAVTPHIFDLYKFGATKLDGERVADLMIAGGRVALDDVEPAHLVRRDGSPTAASFRQLVQIEHTRSGTPWIGNGLAPALASLTYPLHFIDFETSLLALPYHKGMRGYEKVTFQWSCHTVAAPAARPVHREWLNNVDRWPNVEFARTLRDAIGEEGSVLTWSHYEGNILKEIRGQLERYAINDPALDGWIERVIDHRIVDLCRLCEKEFFHPGMRGRVSIKVVLDTLWKADATMRARYVEWSGQAADPGVGPYEGLPPVRVAGRELNVADGTGAMQAYTAMLYGVERDEPDVRTAWEGLLRRYCELDTLAMVLIWDHWRRAVA
jgi:hypothetical protein